MQQPFSRTNASGPQKRIGHSKELDVWETAVSCVLRSMRRASALSQKELADKCGMTQSSLSRCENDQRRITVGEMQRIASALGVEPVEIWNTATTVVLDAKAIVKNLSKLPAARAIATAELVGAIRRADSKP